MLLLLALLVLVGQAAAPEAHGVQFSAWDGTVLGLLAIVLGAVGLFLRWYLPEQLKTFREEQAALRAAFATEQAQARETFGKQLEAERQVWLNQLQREQDRSERVIQSLCTEFETAVGKFDQHTQQLSENTHAVQTMLRERPA